MCRPPSASCPRKTQLAGRPPHRTPLRSPLSHAPATGTDRDNPSNHRHHQDTQFRGNQKGCAVGDPPHRLKDLVAEVAGDDPVAIPPASARRPPSSTWPAKAQIPGTRERRKTMAQQRDASMAVSGCVSSLNSWKYENHSLPKMPYMRSSILPMGVSTHSGTMPSAMETRPSTATTARRRPRPFPRSPRQDPMTRPAAR